MKKLLIVFVCVVALCSGCTVLTVDTPTIKARYAYMFNKDIEDFDGYIDNEGRPHVSFNSAKTDNNDIISAVTEAAVKGAIEGAKQ